LMQLGSDFHRLVHQHLLGLPEAALTGTVSQIAALNNAPELVAMWQNYLAHRPAELAQEGITLYPELSLSTVIAGRRLMAKFDLVAVLPGQPAHLLIVDWKTGHRRPSAQTLRNRVQSRVYPFVLAQAGLSLTDDEVLDPGRISMSYWFANQPAAPVFLLYSQAQLEQDRLYLTELIETIVSATDFPLTSERKACRYCVYRSYCDRGQEPGSLDEFEDDLTLEDLTLDWEQISEIAY